MRLFICHASEDKEDFVEPLAASLEKVYDVWLDTRELTLGDSLLGKISEGLNSSDFGVVVLSPHFFRKKWPRAELDGLFALETSTRKVILPIWKDVTEDDVRQFSAILAGRYAVRASDGMVKVVEEIRLAVDTSARQRQLTNLQSASDRFKGLDETLTEHKQSAALLGAAEGAQLLRGAIDALFAGITTTLSELSATSGVLKFQFFRGDSVTFRAQGNFGINLHLHVRSLSTNAATSARFVLTIFKESDPFETEFEIVSKEEFEPAFRQEKQVVWKAEGGNRTLSTEELGGHALDVFRAAIEKSGKAREQ